MKVPWLSKSDISLETDILLGEYEEMIGQAATPPIPVEDIITRLLGIRINYLDFTSIRGMEDVLGATYVRKRLICINEELLSNPSNGRAYYTMGHEVGHWQLHRRYVNAVARLNNRSPEILCRSGNAKMRIEWQADYFAACLLMPETHVRQSFEKFCGLPKIEIHNVKSLYASPLCFDPAIENWRRIAEEIISVGHFTNVSKQAMIIRLEEFGLIENKTNCRMGWWN